MQKKFKVFKVNFSLCPQSNIPGVTLGNGGDAQVSHECTNKEDAIEFVKKHFEEIAQDAAWVIIKEPDNGKVSELLHVRFKNE